MSSTAFELCSPRFSKILERYGIERIDVGFDNFRVSCGKRVRTMTFDAVTKAFYEEGYAWLGNSLANIGRDLAYFRDQTRRKRAFVAKQRSLIVKRR